ncbi:MAG TPA: retropepsin-like aspartic protease [Candidatus Binatia bacterium]|nr:retropepsin-like aspartic protease [Candidatus Binatia bacterium]
MSARTGAALLVVLAALAVPASGAQGYAPADITTAQLFERNKHAVGSLEAGTYRVVSQERSALGDVWTTETLTDGRNFRTTVRIGGFATSYGADAGVRWQQDENGLVLPTTGIYAELDPFVASMRNAQNPESGVRLLGLSTGDSPALVVEVTPRNGLVERRYYDPHTYLLTRLDFTDYDGHQQTYVYGDYRQVAGRSVAYAIGYERDGKPVTQTKVQTYERVRLSPADFTPPTSKPLFDLGGRDAVVIPARFTDSGVIVNVSIAGRGLDFLLDTGSSDLLIDPAVAGELGMSLTGVTALSFGGDFTMANTRAPDLSVGPLSAKNVAFSTASFEEQLPDQRVVGLLGTDFVASGALEIDFEKKALTLMRSAPADLTARGWSALPLRLDYGVPLVKASYSNLPGYFVVDLGAVYSMLYPHYFSQFPNLVPRGTPDEGELVMIGGKPFGVKHITMRSMTLGDWVFGGVQVVVPSVQYAQERDYDGLIGRDTLSDFNMIFDYANARLWFKPIAEALK